VMSRVLKVAIVQKRLADFRVPIFARLAAKASVDLTVITSSAYSQAVPFRTQTVAPLRVSLGSGDVVFQPAILSRLKSHDVIVLEGSLRFLTSVAIALGRRIHGVPIVWWTSMHDPSTGRVSFPSGRRAVLLRRVLNNVDAIATYSNEATSVLRRQNVAWRIVTAPNVLDTDLLQTARSRWLAAPSRLAGFRLDRGLGDRPLILSVGRLIAAKRTADLIVALRMVRSQRPELEPILAIVGGGPEREQLERTAVLEGVREDVVFAGEIRDLDAVCPWFLAASVFVLPGSGGLAVYEALAHGVPVIAARGDGTERAMIREGTNGFVVEPGDIPTLAERIMSVLDATNAEWNLLSNESRAVALGPYHVERMIDGLWASIHAATDPTILDATDATDVTDAHGLAGSSISVRSAD
jgi:glycosyltransferase involved in cell wall biosynthesis